MNALCREPGKSIRPAAARRCAPPVGKAPLLATTHRKGRFTRGTARRLSPDLLDGRLGGTHTGIGLSDTKDAHLLPRPTIEAFDRHLLGVGLRFEGVVIGGSALGLMGIIQRPTRDFDILVPELPLAIASAARDFAKALARRLGHGV